MRSGARKSITNFVGGNPDHVRFGFGFLLLICNYGALFLHLQSDPITKSRWEEMSLFHFNPSAVGERGQTLYCYEVEGPRGQKLMCFQHAFRQDRGWEEEESVKLT